MLTKVSHSTIHPHSEHMKQYWLDANVVQNPWELWQFRPKGTLAWETLTKAPRWDTSCEYRRYSTELLHGDK